MMPPSMIPPSMIPPNIPQGMIHIGMGMVPSNMPPPGMGKTPNVPPYSIGMMNPNSGSYVPPFPFAMQEQDPSIPKQP